jgi:hypothetical protein
MLVNTDKPKAAPTDVAQAATQYSIGDPTDEEQMYLELINRARRDAVAEAERLIALAATNHDVFEQFVTAWNVDAELMRSQFAALPPVPPLSLNARLTTAARGHSQYQFDNALQTHTGSGGTSVGQRITAAGYVWGNIGENVFLNATSPEHGHAGFDIDWGPGVGGMQTPAGHRITIHNATYSEVGIGVVNGTKTVNGNDAGPQVVTQDFGRPQTATTFITGVAYYDINGNNFYDLGEGLPGVQVKVDGVTTFAVTTTSGGYSVPVTPNRTHTVRFTSSGRPEAVETAVVATANVKVDYKPAYVLPTATGPAAAFVGVDNVYTTPALPGATGYRARVTEVGQMAPEGAEGNLDRLTITTTGGYEFISTAVRASGSASFHFWQVLENDELYPQTILFNESIVVGSGAHIDFQSKMAIAGSGQFAALEVSTDGVVWNRLWSQNGAGQAGEETQFSAKTADLSAYAGQTIRVRFVFDVDGSAIIADHTGPFFNRLGWFLDDVTFVDVNTILNQTESAVLAQPRFAFRPTAMGTYTVEFQAINGARTFAYGPAQAITVEAQPPSVSLSKQIAMTPTTVTLQFEATGGTPSSIVLASSASVTGPYAPETVGVSVSGPDQGRYTITAPRTGDARFYAVLVGF